MSVVVNGLLAISRVYETHILSKKECKLPRAKAPWLSAALKVPP